MYSDITYGQIILKVTIYREWENVLRYHLWSIHMESNNLQGMGECIGLSLMVDSYGKSQFIQGMGECIDISLMVNSF